MSPSLNYLTVQDILWINLQVTKKVHHFNFARLEEATFYQYAYGESNSLLPQAARFITGFLKMHPLDAGNEATALVAVLSFLKINGVCLKINDSNARSWFDRVVDRQIRGLEAIEEIASVEGHCGDGHAPDVRAGIGEVLALIPNTITGLGSQLQAAS